MPPLNSCSSHYRLERVQSWSWLRNLESHFFGSLKKEKNVGRSWKGVEGVCPRGEHAKWFRKRTSRSRPVWWSQPSGMTDSLFPLENTSRVTWLPWYAKWWRFMKPQAWVRPPCKHIVGQQCPSFKSIQMTAPERASGLISMWMKWQLWRGLFLAEASPLLIPPDLMMKAWTSAIQIFNLWNDFSPSNLAYLLTLLAKTLRNLRGSSRTEKWRH